jgi:hypothetical protein
VPVTLQVKSDDPAIRTQREAAAQRVLDYFGVRLPHSRLLCFLDDEDPSSVRGDRGIANRGLYGPIQDMADLEGWPNYVRDCIYPIDRCGGRTTRVIDDLVYLYGSTCANEVGLTMTLAHELQHAIQHAKARKIWAVNGLVPQLPKPAIAALKLEWSDIPIERETRIVPKRAAVAFFGEQRVTQFIDEKIAEGITDSDVADWQFIRALTASSSVDLVVDTQRLFKRLKDYRSELESFLQEKKGNNPDFGDIDLDGYF